MGRGSALNKRLFASFLLYHYLWLSENFDSLSTKPEKSTFLIFVGVLVGLLGRHQDMKSSILLTFGQLNNSKFCSAIQYFAKLDSLVKISNTIKISLNA